jgi:hypothetical protein
MAEQHGSIIEFPRRKYVVSRVSDPLKEEAEHFYQCPACGRWVDCRDLSQVFDHEGPLPHPGRRLAPTKFNCALNRSWATCSDPLPLETTAHACGASLLAKTL